MPTLTVLSGPAGFVRLQVSASVGAWTVYASPASGILTPAWSAVAAGVVDGTTNVPAATFGDDGGYWAYLADTAGISAPLYLVADSGANPVQERILTAVRDEIEAMGLDGIEPDRIIDSKVPVDRYLIKVLASSQFQDLEDESPAIIVSPDPERRDQRLQFNRLTKTDYRCLVSLFRGNEGDPVAERARQLKWRHQIDARFNQQTMAALPEVSQFFVEFGELFPFVSFQRLGRDVQSLILIADTCEAA